MTQAPVRVVLADDTDDIRLLTRTVLDLDGGFEVVGEASTG
jgi:DNA-binding NarL/FixJ family response regulator